MKNKLKLKIWVKDLLEDVASLCLFATYAFILLLISGV